MDSESFASLASYRRCIERIATAWPAFRTAHANRLRHGGEAEKVAEAIIEDLFTQVLDWERGDLMYQVGYADIVVSVGFRARFVLVRHSANLSQSKSNITRT